MEVAIVHGGRADIKDHEASEKHKSILWTRNKYLMSEKAHSDHQKATTLGKEKQYLCLNIKIARETLGQKTEWIYLGHNRWRWNGRWK